MRIRSLLSIFAVVALAGCAGSESEPEENVTINFRILFEGTHKTTLVLNGLTSSCTATRDRSAAYFLVANEIDEPQVCDLSCVFGDPDAGEETFILECDDVRISANAPRAAYCRRDVGDLKQGLGEISKFNAICE